MMIFKSFLGQSKEDNLLRLNEAYNLFSEDSSSYGRKLEVEVDAEFLFPSGNLSELATEVCYAQSSDMLDKKQSEDCEIVAE